MQVALLPPRQVDHCAPLTTGRELSDCLIANVKIGNWIEQELIRAGFDLVPVDKSGPHTLFVPIDHWIGPRVLIMLGRTSRPTSLFSSDGELLAWTGARDPEQCTSRMVSQDHALAFRYPWDMLTANEHVLRQLGESKIHGEISSLSVVEGTIHLGKGSRLLPGVFVEGKVIIGENCRIGPNAHIRGCTSIADHCIIGNGVEVKNSIIYPHSSVRHYGFVGDSILGAHVHLGAGTILSNARHDGKHQFSKIGEELIDTGRNKFGAVIGDGVRTGVSTVVFPGRKIGRARTTPPSAIVDKDLL